MSKPIAYAACLLTALLLAACAPKTGPAKFYRLEPASVVPSATKEAQSPARVIGLGPVRVPAYLDRPQIVTGGAGNRMNLDEYNRWAEPLRDTLGPVLSENLASQLPGVHLIAFPWNRALTPDYEVEIDFTRFHVNAEGIAELWANWSILRHNKPLLLSKSRIALAAAGRDVDALVAAQNRTLAQFGQELAQALRKLPIE